MAQISKVLASSVENCCWTKQMDKADVVVVFYKVAMGFGETPQSPQHPVVEVE